MINHQILTELKNHLLQHYGHSIIEVILFGSRTHGDSKPDSDYDILILLDQDYSGKDENKILDLCYDICLKYNILFDVHLLSKEEINSIRGRQPVFVNAIKSGIYA